MYVKCIYVDIVQLYNANAIICCILEIIDIIFKNILVKVISNGQRHGDIVDENTGDKRTAVTGEDHKL